MTTIAYHHKDGQIAVDSRIVSAGLVKCDTFDKTVKNEHGTWVFCGKATDIKDLCNLKHNDKVDPIPDCSALLVSGGKCYEVSVNNDGYCEHFELSFSEAKGSGCELALAAMDHGKSAKEAVEYAMTRDIYTGGKVQVIDVKTGKIIP